MQEGLALVYGLQGSKYFDVYHYPDYFHPIIECVPPS